MERNLSEESCSSDQSELLEDDRLSYGSPGSAVIRKRFGSALLHMKSLPDFVSGAPALAGLSTCGRACR